MSKNIVQLSAWKLSRAHMFNDIYSSILRELVDFHPHLAASEYYDAKGSNEKIIGAVYKVNPTSTLD